MTPAGPEPGDTIAAIATAPGRGGIGVVRISGTAAAAVARALAGPLPEPRRAARARFLDPEGRELDRGLLLWFPGPRSFTGEDVAELHAHGGPVLLDLILAAALHQGARLARPGEFSERAFLNGKLDLAQAEAVADLIDAASAEAVRSAAATLEGAFSARVGELAQGILRLRTYVEAALDFPDEDVDFLAEPRVAASLRDLRQDLDDTLESARQGAALREGMHLVIAGRPNVGKSSLLNALAGRSTAIVTDIPGTTRDLLREQILLDGLPLHLVDTAGLRDSADPVEQIGIARARDALAGADLVLLVTDDSEAGHPEDAAALASLPAGLPRLLVANKIDRSGRDPGLDPRADPPLAAVSARTGAGLDALRAHLKATMGYRPGEGRFIARRRHLDALGRAGLHLEAAATRLAGAESPELVAEELHLAHDALGEITGRVHADDLLGAIFSTFCIGK